jgi:ATP-dependent RNA helicase DDX21
MLYLEYSKLIFWHVVCFSGGRTIIFAEKKESASELAGLLPGARALHGDIQQSQREVSYELIWFLILDIFIE